MSTVEKRHVFVFFSYQKITQGAQDNKLRGVARLRCSTQSTTSGTLPGARFRSRLRQRKKGTPQGDALFLAEKERFEFSNSYKIGVK